MKPSITRISHDLVEIKIGKKTYHIISDETPILGVNKFVNGKIAEMTDEEKNHMLLHFHRFRQMEES